VAGADLAARLDRIESAHAITQLVARYALALDARDAKAWAELYVPDVKVGAPIHGVGRAALEQWVYAKCSYWYRSVHLIGAHHIEFDDDDHAHGDVQCRIEQEIGEHFVTTFVLYRDHYERREGEWLFAHRRGLPQWCYRHGEDPLESGFETLPTGMPIRLPAANTSFASFWENFTEEEISAVTRHPLVLSAAGQSLRP
jgi:hypothetical protein